MDKLKAMTTNQLCEAFTLTNNNHSEEIPMVRGWIMDELESRNGIAFEAWMMTEDVKLMDNPTSFFM